MPTYEYRCRECGEHLEVVQSFSDDPLTECPACAGPLAQGVQLGRHRVQGQRLLQDRQPAGRPRPAVRVELVVRSGSAPTSVVERRARRPRPRRRFVVLVVEQRLVDRTTAGERLVSATAGDGPRADVGVYGGSGLYSLLDDVEEVALDTPYGPPSAPVDDRRGRRAAGGVPAPPRARPHAAAAPGALPGQRLGHARARACGRCSPRSPAVRCSPTSTRASSWSSTRSSTGPSGRPSSFHDGPGSPEGSGPGRPRHASPSPTTPGCGRSCSRPARPRASRPTPAGPSW